MQNNGRRIQKKLLKKKVYFAYWWSCIEKDLHAGYDVGLFINYFDLSNLPLYISHTIPICSFAQSDLIYSAVDENIMNNIYVCAFSSVQILTLPKNIHLQGAMLLGGPNMITYFGYLYQ